MSLDIYLTKVMPTTIYTDNVTHNLNVMAGHAGIYELIWRPEEVGIIYAYMLIKPLETAIKKMEENPDEYKKFNPENGWGNYDVFLDFLKNYLTACNENPDATIEVSR